MAEGFHMRVGFLIFRSRMDGRSVRHHLHQLYLEQQNEENDRQPRAGDHPRDLVEQRIRFERIFHIFVCIGDFVSRAL